MTLGSLWVQLQLSRVPVKNKPAKYLPRKVPNPIIEIEAVLYVTEIVCTITSATWQTSMASQLLQTSTIIKTKHLGSVMWLSGRNLLRFLLPYTVISLVTDNLRRIDISLIFLGNIEWSCSLLPGPEKTNTERLHGLPDRLPGEVITIWTASETLNQSLVWYWIQ
jgi:hypothetical protein